MGSEDKTKESKRKYKSKIKLKYSISLKITLIVVFLSVIIIFAIGAINIYTQAINERELLKTTANNNVGDFARSHEVLTIIEGHVISYEIFNDSIGLHKFISDRLEEFNNQTENKSNYNTEIIQININKPIDNNSVIYVSTNNNSIGEVTNPYNMNSTIKGDTFYIKDNPDEPILTIISPINLSGNIIGTYEIVLYSPPEDQSYEEEIKYVIIISFIGILILIIGLLFLLRRFIVNPIITFRDKSKVIGTGDLDTRVDINSNDELGELADAFNKMAEDLKESRDKVEEYNEILEKLLHQKDDFIGQLGHDLKNPLQPLVGLLPMLIEQEDDPGTKETLQVMYKNAEYMKELIFDTLKLAKLRSQNIEFNMEDINLRIESDSVIDTQKLYLKERGVIVENRIPKDVIVEADKLRVAEVFKNLITNSVKYTPEKKGKIILDAKVEDKWVTVSVKDNGIGMTKEQLKKIFDEFYKADRASSDYYSTGLGLSIAKRIVENHGGKIWVDSEGLDKGTTFYFTLKNKTKNN